MKFSLAYALAVVALADAAAIGKLDIAQNLKGAVETSAQILDEPCSMNSQDCSVAKRNALALAEAAANTYLSVNPTAEPCYADGAPCNVAKRQEIESLESRAAEEAAEKASPEDEAGASVEEEEGRSDDVEKRSADPRKWSSNYAAQGSGNPGTKNKRDPYFHGKFGAKGSAEPGLKEKRDPFFHGRYGNQGTGAVGN